MLYMVIERPRDVAAVGARFRECGRMMPEGVIYRASWLETDGDRCFQIMEAPDRKLLGEWMSHWDDLVDFEVVEVLTSADYWARH
jgi:hypothetical protein